MIAPAPRKPMPLTICTAMLVGSTARNSAKPYAETRVNSAEPTQTTACVRRPAARSRSSRSAPIAPPRTAAMPSRRRMCGQLREIAADSIGLLLADQAAAARSEIEQLAERVPREGIFFRRRLHLDEPAVAGHDDVHVGVGVGILGVVEIEHGHPVDDADGHSSDRVLE